MAMRTFRFGILSFFLVVSLRASAQRPVPGLRPEETTVDSAANKHILPLDEPVPATYVLIGDPDVRYSFLDTLDWRDIRHMPLPFTDAYLGNWGSATRSFLPEQRQLPGARTGWLQYEPYYIQPEEFRFYDQDIPVAQAAHSQASQEDTYFTLDFGRSFARGLNFSTAYRRINQVGEYGHQRHKTTGLGIGVWHDAPNGRYDAYYLFMANGAVSQENGGIAAPELIGDPLYPDPSVPVHVTDGITEHKHRSFLTRHLLRLTRDSAGIGIDLFAQLRLSSGLYKYVDESAISSADYYGSIFFPDSRGIRQFTYERERELSAGVAFPLKKIRSSLQGSLRYRHVRFDQEPDSRKVGELYAEARGLFNAWRAVRLQGDLSLGLGRAGGNLAFKATGDLSIGPLGALEGHWNILARKPYLVEEGLFVDALPVYSADWKNPFIQDVGVAWVWEKQKFRAGIQWLLFDNYIYFDSLRLPQQAGSTFSLQRLTVSKSFDFRSFGLRLSAIWQPDPDARLAVPSFLGTVGLYARIRLFRQRVDLMPGVDITYHDGLTGNSYFPVNGVYHLTGGPAIPSYLRIDPGLTMKINFLQVYVRMEDIAGAWLDRVLYESDYYPHYPGYLRFGLSASFFN